MIPCLNAERKQVRGEVLFEIRLEELPAQLERNLEPLNRGNPARSGPSEGESLFQTCDGAREIGSQLLRFCHSSMRCCATLRNFSGTRLKSTTSIVKRVGASLSSSWIAARAGCGTGAGPSMPMSISERSAADPAAREPNRNMR